MSSTACSAAGRCPASGCRCRSRHGRRGPVGAWAANVDADATTSAAVIGLNAATIERWDWATAISYVAVQRSSPDAISTIYAGAIQNFYSAVETKIATLLDTTAGTPNAAIKLGAGIGAFYTASGTAPEVIVVAPDVWGLLADAGRLSVPFGFANGGFPDTSDAGLTSLFAGVPIVARGKLAAGTKYLATRRALDVRVSDPVQLTANAIGALNVELGVVGEGLFDGDVALETMELAAGAPVVLDAQTQKEYDAAARRREEGREELDGRMVDGRDGRLLPRPPR